MVKFQSTRPIRGATRRWRGWPRGGRISIHAPHTGRDQDCGILRVEQRISIHAPHTGRDGANLAPLRVSRISIHAPHTGRDPVFDEEYRIPLEFQSTRPIRGATVSIINPYYVEMDFNPRAPYGARLQALIGTVPAGFISIHAPHTGRDVFCLAAESCFTYFNPRAPYGARLRGLAHLPGQKNFNPRAPYGARPHGGDSVHQRGQFQSTRPIRGATAAIVTPP